MSKMRNCSAGARFTRMSAEVDGLGGRSYPRSAWDSALMDEDDEVLAATAARCKENYSSLASGRITGQRRGPKRVGHRPYPASSTSNVERSLERLDSPQAH